MVNEDFFKGFPCDTADVCAVVNVKTDKSALASAIFHDKIRNIGFREDSGLGKETASTGNGAGLSTAEKRHFISLIRVSESEISNLNFQI